MDRYIEGHRRDALMLPMSLDDYISQDNIVRVINKFVDSLDFSSMNFQYETTQKRGRRPFNPADMTKLYTYGYLNGIRSSRDLEKECVRNVELMFLMKKLKPHNKTISNFRRENLESFSLVFAQFLIILNHSNLLGKKVVAIDGSKIRASNSRRNYLTENKLKKQIEHYREKAREYARQLDEEDEKIAKQEHEINIDEVNDRIEQLQELLEEVKEEGSRGLTDPDCKMMKTSGDGFEASHNAQIAVDGKNNLVLGVDVTSSPTDHGQLCIMIKQVNENIEMVENNSTLSNDKVEDNKKEKLKVLADKGYYQGEDLENCEEHAETFVAKQNSSKTTKEIEYTKDKFEYDKDNNTYTCPEGQILSCISRKNTKDKKYRNKKACQQCPNKHKCTASEFRTITRGEYQDIMDIVDQRTVENKDLYRLRQMIVEPVFGTVKRALGFTYFLTTGSKSVKAELMLLFLSYNILRATNILGTKKLIEEIEAFSAQSKINKKEMLAI